MKPYIRYFLIILTVVSNQPASSLVDISCFKYEPAMVTLIGVLKAKTYPGPPNFVSIESGDAPETVYYIELRPPICTITKEESWMFGHERVSEVQLAMSKMQFDQLGANLGGVISINGSLFEASNGHHHTPVLLDVKSFEGTEKRSVAANLKDQSANQTSIHIPIKVNKKVKITKKKK